MNHKIKPFYSTLIIQFGKFGGINVGRFGVIFAVVAAVILTSCNTPAPQPSNTAQNVLVFVSGLNTTLDDQCHEGTFDQFIHSYLVNQVGVTNPYAQGCDSQGESFLNANSSIIQFGYNKGTMDAQHGVWIPNKFNGCDVDNHRLADDITNFSDMLAAYQKVFPKATFTIVGHSLGGLVALQGAYNYAEVQHHHSITRVMTIDSPLEGIFVTEQANNWLKLGSLLCRAGVGPVVSDDLVPLGNVSFVSPLCTPNQGAPSIQSPLVLSQCAARALSKDGVGVVTMGNDKDALYCQPGWITVIGQVSEKACDTQVLLSEPATFRKMYDYGTPFSTPHPGDVEKLAHDHGTLLVTPAVEQDLARYILAPVVSITQPAIGDTNWFKGTGTPVHFSATVHCLWGSVNHAEAVIRLENQSMVAAGTFQPNYSGFTFKLQGTTILPASVQGDTATFYISAGGNACNYPSSIKTISSPSDDDYLNGATHGVPFSLDGGKLALGMNGHLYASRLASDFFSSSSLNYSSFNQQGDSNSIFDIAWSHDGMKLAYLVNVKGDSIDGSSSVDLYVTTSMLVEPKVIAKNLPNAVALTWNTDDNKIAVLEEAAKLSQTFNFVPSIVIIDAHTEAIDRQIALPTSTMTSSFFCEIICGRGRSRIQWGADGMFLIGNGEVGSRLVTATGQVSELSLPSGSGTFFSPDMAPVGALNTEGTLIAYPTRADSAGKASILLYQVDPSTGKVGNPSTLATFPQGSFTLGATVDFSPDGNKIGLCADKGVFTLGIQQPSIMQTVENLPGNFDNLSATQHSFTCENLRWSADGTSIIVQLAGSPESEYDLIVGQAVLFLNSLTSQVLSGCGISSTPTGLQFSGVFDSSCPYAPSAFSWQPIHN